MIKQFSKLTNEDRELILNAPILVSILASCTFQEVDAARKTDAIEMAHLKTFTAEPMLLTYYGEVEKTFKTKFEAALKAYQPFDAEKHNAMKQELNKVNEVMARLDRKYAKALRKSLEGYSLHVKNASHSIFEDFIFPIPIPGLSV